LTRKKRRAGSDTAVDPFGERSLSLFKERLHVLGGVFDFESNSQELLRLAHWAYNGLPRYRLASPAPRFRVRLMLAAEKSGTLPAGEPAALELYSGSGLLGAAPSSATFVTLSPEQNAALVAVSRNMLPFLYHIRYELIEFAVFTLAGRAQGLVPLHAACVGSQGRGILLAGETGAGKSTLTLHCLLNGFDFMSEDSVFVDTGALRAIGVGNFLHVRADSVRFLSQQADVAAIRNSPVIRRRSGVEKFEVDVRTARYRIAPAPLQLAAVVFASSGGRGSARLRPLRLPEVLRRFKSGQPYASGRPEWTAFKRSIARLPAFELQRGNHPSEAIPLLREVVEAN